MSDWVKLPDIEGFDAFTGSDEWHSVFTIQLSQLIETGIFDWESENLDWSSAAYDDAQYMRVCNGFVSRFMWREISMIPPGIWMQRVRHKLVYEIMPKYRPLYEALEEGVNVLADSDEYYKSRKIESDYPETLLSGNADYVSHGQDLEDERVKIGNIPDNMDKFVEKYKSVDELVLDDLECMFISLYTANVNGW